jgi:cell fate regulator YaaT (PSP1 superfamily)
MPKIVGVQFRPVGKIYYFDPQGTEYNDGDLVIVETVRGLELGQIVLTNRELENSELEHELKTILRKATPEDVEEYKYNLELAKKSLTIFARMVEKSGLPMKPLDCEYTIDRSKVLFYYSADDRVDFRDLLKELAAEFRVRIELRQVGVREAARFIGGIGNCGREVCCKKHLREFDLITMKMAKEQAMSLNSNKISGLCGKLMCCIAYESELYKELHEEVPGVGEWVRTPNCERCKVISADYLRKIIKTDENQDGMPVVYHAHEVSRLVKNSRKQEEIDLMEDETDGSY